MPIQSILWFAFQSGSYQSGIPSAVKDSTYQYSVIFYPIIDCKWEAFREESMVSGEINWMDAGIYNKRFFCTL